MNPMTRAIINHLRESGFNDWAEHLEFRERRLTKTQAANIAYAHALERPIIININNGKATVEEPKKAKL